MARQGQENMQGDTKRFWFGWTMVTLVGYTVGLPAVLFISLSIPYDGQPPLLIGFVGGAELGATIGIAQWLLLRRHITVTLFWVIASIVGGALGMAPGMFISETIAPSIIAAYQVPLGGMWHYTPMAALFGLSLGTAQWWHLRQVARSTGWWIVANRIGWTVGMGSGSAMAGILTSAVGVLGYFLIPGLLTGAITGYLVVRARNR